MAGEGGIAGSAGETVPEPAVADEPALDLTSCDREPIHVPGSIQPHGLLLIAELDRQEVIGGAGDIERRLGPDWLGRPVSVLLGQKIGEAVVRAEAMSGAVVPLSPVPGRREALDASLHISGKHILIELEPRPEEPITAAALLSWLDAAGMSFERAIDLKTLCQQAAVSFRELTGFDRVMIYRFLDDAAGVVVGEDRDPTLSSFMHHHFPATDIPRQARALYVRNRVRVIPDIFYDPAPIRPDHAGLEGIDLTDAALRSVSPIHLQYMRNMGVGASASVSIVKDGLLWGLVACHHSRPRQLGYELRAAARALAGGLARQIRAKEEAESYRERIRLRRIEDSIVAEMDREASFERSFEDLADEMRRMIDADGFAAIQGKRVTTAGRVPPPAALRQIACWVGPQTASEPFATAELERQMPEAAAWRETSSGLLAACLAAEQSILLMWFRAEEPETVEWAGNPHKHSPADPQAPLTPRSSFEAWRETVRGRARRWTAGEVEAANRLRRSLFELRQGRRLRELNRELGAMITDREALLVEKDHLLREVNHRVQNSLQLVQAFLGLQAKDAVPELSATLNEAQRRLSAVALVHRRLYQADQLETVDLGRYLEELLTDMRAAMGAEWHHAIRADLAPILIAPDRALHVGLILTELVINAQKYAYGGGAGPVTVQLEQYRDKLRLIVSDRGSGQTGDRRGFGTRMIEAMTGRLGGTIERQDNGPGMRVILTAPVDD